MQLSSISGLEDVTVKQQNIAKSEALVENEKSYAVQQEINQDKNPVEMEHSDDGNDVEKFTITQDPQYAKYFRMVQFGVPLQAVQLKMQTEGLDPSVLE